MKKVLFLIVVMFVTISLNAQVDFCIGPKVGYQATKLSLKKVDVMSDFKGNMTFGVFGRVAISKLVIQPELLYAKSSKMVKIRLLGVSNPPTMTANQSNFILPIHIGYQFLDLDFIKMRVTAAPVFYFAVGKTKFTSDSFTIKSKDSLTEDVCVGAALNLGLDIWRFTFDLGYSLGLTETMDDDIELPYDIELGDDAKQNVFTLTLGFKFL